MPTLEEIANSLNARGKKQDAKREDEAPVSALDSATQKLIADTVAKSVADAFACLGKKADNDAAGDDSSPSDDAERHKTPSEMREETNETRADASNPVAGRAVGGEKFADAQARADAIYRGAKNIAAPQPMSGETLHNYRRRLVRGLQALSPDWKDVDIRSLHASALDLAETKVFSDALESAKNPVVPEGRLLEHRNRDASGREIVTFSGRPSAWLRQFSRPPMRAKFRPAAKWD